MQIQCHVDHAITINVNTVIVMNKKNSPEMLADFTKNKGDISAEKSVALVEVNVGYDKVVTLPCMRSVLHDVACPNDGGGHVAALPRDGTIPKHVQSVSLIDQDKDPEFNGPNITDNDYRGCGAHTSACLGPRAAEVLSLEMSHGTSQIGDPHFTHAVLNSVCDGVDAEAHKIIKSRHIYDCCCCTRATRYPEDWLNHFGHCLGVCMSLGTIQMG